MRYARPIFLESAFFTGEPGELDELEEVDQLDELFGQLQQLEPPPSLIARILASFSRLSHPQPPVWDELDGLVVRNEKQDPS
jgi:hypothetical protein